MPAALHQATSDSRRSLKDMMSSLHRMKLGDAPAAGAKDRAAHAGPPMALVVESAGRSASGGSEASAGSASSLGGRPHTIQRSPLGRSVVTALEAEMDQVASSPELLGSPHGAENEALSGYATQDRRVGLTPGHSGSATPVGFEHSSFASGRPQTATPDASPTKGRKGASPSQQRFWHSEASPARVLLPQLGRTAEPLRGRLFEYA